MGSDLLCFLNGAAIFKIGGYSRSSKGVATNRVGECGCGGPSLDHGENPATIQATTAQLLSIHCSKEWCLALIRIATAKVSGPQIGVDVLLGGMVSGHLMEFAALLM